MKIEIDGVGQVEVGDEFGSMTPDQQTAVVGHIAEQASKGVTSGLGGNTIGAETQGQPDTKAAGLAGLDQQLGAGAIRGASAALFPPSTANFLEKGADWLWNKVMPAGPAGPRPGDATDTSLGPLSRFAAPGAASEAAAGKLQQGLEAVTAQAGTPANDKEAIAERLGTYLGGGAVSGVGPVRSALGAAGDIIAGKLAEGTPYETPARVVGGILGGAVPSIANKAASLAAPKISPERQAAIQTLEQANVPVTAGQATGNPTLRYAEATLGGSKARDIQAQQGEALAKEVMGRAGSPGELMTRENMEKGFDRLGQSYEDIGRRNSLNFDLELKNDLGQAIYKYEQQRHVAQNKPAFYNEVSKIVDAEQSGLPMSGLQYQDWRSQLGKSANSLRERDPVTADGLNDIKKALDSAFNRSVGDPADAAALRDTNRQYSALKGVQKGIERAGGDPILGLLGQNPAATLRAMATGTKGHRGFTDLADASGTLLKPLPDSGTAQRLNQYGTIAAMMYDISHGRIPVAAIGKTVGGKAAGMALMSDLAQNYLKGKYPAAPVQLQRGLVPAFAANPGILSQLPYSGQ